MPSVSPFLNKCVNLANTNQHSTVPILEIHNNEEVVSNDVSNLKLPQRTRIYSFDDKNLVQPQSLIENYQAGQVSSAKVSQAVHTNEKSCRICFEGEEVGKDKGPLICPCLCNGSLKYIHEECIKRWLVQRDEEDEENNYKIGARCEICQYWYHLQIAREWSFSCQRPCNDGLSNLLVATGLIICLFNLVWLVAK